jgi:hypothetical protein
MNRRQIAVTAGALAYTGTKRGRGDVFARGGLTDGSLQVLAAAAATVKNDIDWRGQLLRLEVGDWAAVYEGGQPTRP